MLYKSPTGRGCHLIVIDVELLSTKCKPVGAEQFKMLEKIVLYKSKSNHILPCKTETVFFFVN